jgi:hypothetical protein
MNNSGINGARGMLFNKENEALRFSVRSELLFRQFVQIREEN